MTKFDNSHALETFLEQVALIKTRLDRLQGAVDNHFDLGPDEINWGHVGDLTHYDNVLKDLTDSVFKEGEYAE